MKNKMMLMLKWMRRFLIGIVVLVLAWIIVQKLFSTSVLKKYVRTTYSDAAFTMQFAKYDPEFSNYYLIFDSDGVFHRVSYRDKRIFDEDRSQQYTELSEPIFQKLNQELDCFSTLYYFWTVDEPMMKANLYINIRDSKEYRPSQQELTQAADEFYNVYNEHLKSLTSEITSQISTVSIVVQTYAPSQKAKSGTCLVTYRADFPYSSDGINASDISEKYKIRESTK